MGDSLIARSDWVERLDAKLEAAFPAADYNTAASAVNGELSYQGLARYDSTVGPLRPTILIVAYGSNDVGASLSYFQYSIDNIIAKGKGQGATVFINLIGPISAAGKSEWPLYNDVIMQVAAKHGIPVINVLSPLSQNKGGYLSDGLHYTPAGSEVVAQTVFNNIVPYLNGLGGRR
jgi:lysophospholipase L1-like esterase